MIICSLALFVRTEAGYPRAEVEYNAQENLLVNKFYGQATKGMR
jgi:hypothetical protein